jgi:hypothetical protein
LQTKQSCFGNNRDEAFQTLKKNSDLKDYEIVESKSLADAHKG